MAAGESALRRSGGTLRVLHVVATGQRRGAEIFTADLVGALAERGVEQSVAVLRGGLAVPYRAPTTMLGADRRVLPGVNVSVAGVRALRQAIRRWDPDVLQAHGGETLKYAVPAAAGTRAQLVYRKIGSTPRAISRGPRRLLYRRLMGRAARVVAVADAVREETIEVFSLPAGRVVTIPNAVDGARLATARPRDDARHALGLPADAEVVLSLGALTWEKDPLAHVQVAGQVLAERPRAWHLMVGDGPLLSAVQAAVGVNGTSARVRLLHARDDVGDLLAASDVLLFASCSEGMPATVIEAGMSGLPVAGYAVAGVSEVVESGVTGLLAPSGDVASLRAHVMALLADADQRRALGAAARERCLTRFDIAAVAPRYLDLYRAVVTR
jgi:glycosyltransferase involved in cell wall biosynthesis